MTPTPRTDEVRGQIAERYNGHGSMSIAYTEMGKWADKLERELEENIAIISLGRKVKEWNAEEIAGLKQQLTAHKAALEKARVAFGQSEPWSILEILEKLSEAAEILLMKNDYDGHGWETIQHAQLAYRQAIPKLKEALTAIN